MHLSAQLAALIAIMSAASSTALTRSARSYNDPRSPVDGPALTAVMGNVHRFGDRRLPMPGMLGMIASATP